MTGVPGGPPDAGRGRPPAWLQEKLFERRIVFAIGRLDDAAAAQAAAELMTLDATGDEPIALYLDSPDGTLEAAFVLIDTLDVLRAPVHAHCPGQAGGPAVGVVAVADHRSAAPHATFRLTQPAGQFSGPADQLASRSQQYRDLLRKLEVLLARATGRPPDEIATDLRRGRHLDAQGALDYGLIDEIRAPAPSS